jgi:hypothetical protein
MQEMGGAALTKGVSSPKEKAFVSRVEWLLSDRSRKKPKELQRNL